MVDLWLYLSVALLPTLPHYTVITENFLCFFKIFLNKPSLYTTKDAPIP